MVCKIKKSWCGERLEDRQVMAGDVTFSDGLLTIVMSDDGPNGISIREHGPYVYISGNVEFGPNSGNRLLTTKVERIHVIGSDRADVINLASVGPVNFPSLRGTTIEGGGGNDHIIGSRLADQVFGQDGDDEIHGGAGDDRLAGNKGDDLIFGGDGLDWINGGRGNDYAWGAAYSHDDRWADIVMGGLGRDTYAFPNKYVGLNDIISGFEIDLRRRIG